MCCFGAGRDESGCRFSGIGYADVGWLDDVAGDYRQTVGESMGWLMILSVALALLCGLAGLLFPTISKFRPALRLFYAAARFT